MQLDEFLWKKKKKNPSYSSAENFHWITTDKE